MMSDTLTCVDRLMILMAVYSGADTLEQQPASLHRQTFDAWVLSVSDDDSSDKSRKGITGSFRFPDHGKP